MKNLLKITVILSLFFFFVISACKKDEPETIPASYGALRDYMVTNNLDFPDLVNGSVIDAKPLSETGGIVDTENHCTIPGYHVFDIRSEESFRNGHINGVIRVDFSDVVSMASDYSDKPILVVCADGQAAGYAVMALRLSGYSEAKVLKWGMSGWNNELAAPWNNNAGSENGNKADGHANWISTDAPPLESNTYPTWSSASLDGAAILTERVNALLVNGFQSINSSNVLANPDEYQIVNYWPNDIYKSIGHFAGAFQIENISANDNAIKAFNPEKESLIYCYTGHTSSMLVAWLNVLGYDTKSILFGVNGLKYDALVDLNNPSVIWNGSHEYEYIKKQDEFNNFKSYMIANNMDLSDVLSDWIISAEMVYSANNDSDPSNDFFIIDLRTNEDFQDGHIDRAVNSSLSNVVNAASAANGHPIVVACYTGQLSGFSVVALRLSGYPNAKVLKWGMSSWSEVTSGPWQSNIGDVADGDENWAEAPGDIATNAPQAFPQLIYETNNMDEILADRVSKLIESGYKGVTNVDVLANPAIYFINNFWAVTDVEHYGNIKTAYRILPLSLADGEYAFLDGNAKVITYCWTGHTSSMITAYLTVMGYDAYCLKFGANGMIHTTLESHKFTDAAIMDYPLTSGK